MPTYAWPTPPKSGCLKKKSVCKKCTRFPPPPPGPLPPAVGLQMQEAIHVVCCCWAQRRPPPSLQDPLCEKKTMVVGGGKGGVVDDPIWEGGRKRNEEGAGISAGNCLGAREENYKIQYSTSSAMSNYSKCGCASFLFVCGEAQTMEWVLLLSYLGTVVGGRRGIESVQQGGHIFWLQGGGDFGLQIICSRSFKTTAKQPPIYGMWNEQGAANDTRRKGVRKARSCISVINKHALFLLVGQSSAHLL